jgi:hypothetical protein
LKYHQLEDDTLQLYFFAQCKLLQQLEQLRKRCHFNQLVRILEVSLQEQQNYLAHLGLLLVFDIVKVQTLGDLFVFWFE